MPSIKIDLHSHVCPIKTHFMFADVSPIETHVSVLRHVKLWTYLHLWKDTAVKECLQSEDWTIDSSHKISVKMLLHTILLNVFVALYFWSCKNTYFQMELLHFWSLTWYYVYTLTLIYIILIKVIPNKFWACPIKCSES